MMIHRTAVVHPDAQLDVDVQVGAYTVIGPSVFVGRGTVIASHVVIGRNVRIGAENRISSHVVIGTEAQDMSYKGAPSYVEIGDGNQFREFVTVNRGAHGEAVTRVGSRCLLMTGAHIAHDCVVGDGVIMANLATLGGHVTVGDRVVVGGLAAMHQFVRVGRMAMVGGTAGVTQDVPPYCIVQGTPPATVRGLNAVGLKRNGISSEGMNALKAAYRLVFRRGMTKENAIAEIEASVSRTEEVRHFLEFLKHASRRGVSRAERIEQPGLRVLDGGEPVPGPELVRRLVAEELDRRARDSRTEVDDVSGVGGGA